MLVDVQPTKTVATFVFGVEMTVIANGVKQTVTRAGWQVTIPAGASPHAPAQAAPGSLSPEFAKLAALTPQPNAGDPDKAMQSSGFEAQNSGRGPATVNGSPDPGTLSGATNAISGANSQIQRPTFTPPPIAPPHVGGGGGGGTGGL